MRWQVSLGRVMYRGTFGYCFRDGKNGKKSNKTHLTSTKFSKEKAPCCVNSTMEHAGSRKLETLLLSPFLYDIYLQLADESAPDLRERSLDILEVGGGRHEVRHLGGRYLYDVHKVFRIFLDPISQYGIHATSLTLSSFWPPFHCGRHISFTP